MPEALYYPHVLTENILNLEYLSLVLLKENSVNRRLSIAYMLTNITPRIEKRGMLKGSDCLLDRGLLHSIKNDFYRALTCRFREFHQSLACCLFQF